MATFEIQGTDGKTYQVEAPSMEAAAAAVSGFAAPQGGSSVNQQNLDDFQSGADAVARGVGQGVTFRMGDELFGGLSALGGMRGGANPAEVYQTTRDGVRENNSAAQQAHPGMYGFGEVLGGVGASLPAAPLATGKTLATTATRSSAIGGAEGALFGLGGADGEDIGQSVAENAALGASMGGAAPFVVAGSRALGRKIADPVQGAVGVGNQGRANRVMERAVTRSGRSIDDLQQEALEAGRAGQADFALMDMLGSPGQGAASGVARSPGEGSTELRNFLQTRQLDAGDRQAQALAESLGATDTAAQRQAALRSERSSTADVNYAAAREGARPVDVRGALGVLDTRLGQTASMEGTGFRGDGIDNVFGRFRDRLAADRVPSDVDAIELSDFDRVLGVKQDMQDAAESAMRAGRGNEARELGRVISELDKALEASSDGYRAANDIFRAQSQAIDAVDAGSNAARPSVRAEDAIDQFRGMSPDQQSSFRAGLADSLIGKIEGQAPGANVASPLMRTRTDRLLQEVANDPSKLRAQIARENTMAETRQRAVGGSRTADNLADMDDVQSVDVGVLASLLSGNFGTAATQMGQKAANVATGRNEATNQAIARMLMSNDPASVLRPILERQSRTQGQNRILESLLRNAIARPVTQ